MDLAGLSSLAANGYERLTCENVESDDGRWWALLKFLRTICGLFWAPNSARDLATAV
jgi:hypothetical protein